MINKRVRKRINSELSLIEKENNVRILYACESGSRAWGFPSKNSDYDVRFIYTNPKEWYLSLLELGQVDYLGIKRRDVIEKPIAGDLDIGGWDLKKSLNLFRKSNPPLMEWLTSPIVYRNSWVADGLRDMLPAHYSQTSSTYHYLHMAQGNYRAYLQGDKIWVKKYFYVLRPIMAVMWMEQGLGVVPTDFNVILDGISLDGDVKIAIENLIISKKQGDELRVGNRNNLISGFIEYELNRMSSMIHNYGKPIIPSNVLDDFFLDVISWIGD